MAYGNMLLCLRFRHAIVFTGVAFAGAVLAFYTKPALEPGLQFAFSVQIASACLFTLYANYLTERQRCIAYLTTLEARLRSEFAESTSRAFEDMSRTDALTGLFNRRVLDDQLQRWFSGARRRAEACLAVMMIDIDHFKAFNDCFGHPEGDRCLIQVAKVLSWVSARHGALCTRFGGEEFVIVLFDVEAETARYVAGELARGVRALDIPHTARPDDQTRISISIGIATSNRAGHGDGPARILASADQALYVAKEKGRDRIEFHDAA